MSGVPQSIIDSAIDLILDHIRQSAQYAEGDLDQVPDLDRKLQGIDAELESMAKTLPTLYTRVQARIKTRMLRRKRERNNLVRFNQLPSEVASKILWLSIADPWERRPSCSFLQRHRTISSVCSSWRTLVEGSPQFWSIIEFTNTQPALLTFLEKSKHVPLEIKCFSDGQYNCAPRMERLRQVGPSYCALIAPHTHRIRSLIMSTFWTTDGILAILDKPAPVLEELNLSFRACPLVQPVELFLGQAASLKDVALEHIPVRWDSEVLVGLRSLKMKARFMYSPMGTQVLRLLEGSPELEKLDIEDVENFADEELKFTQVVREQGRLVMSKLQELRLFNLPFELVQGALSNIEIPSIRHLDLECRFRGQPASKLLGPKIQHLASPILQRSTGAELAELTLGQESLGIAIYLSRQEHPPIRIQLKKTVPVAGFDWLAENLFGEDGLPAVGAPEIFQVSLKFGGSFDMGGGTFIPMLDWLDVVKVKDLKIERGCNRVEELIKYLGEMQDGSRWPLPHLRSLKVGGSADMLDHLLVTLQRRKDGISLTETAPVALETLDIEDVSMVDKQVEEALAKFISPSGTFIRSIPRVPFRVRRRRIFEDFLDGL